MSNSRKVGGGGGGTHLTGYCVQNGQRTNGQRVCTVHIAN